METAVPPLGPGSIPAYAGETDTFAQRPLKLRINPRLRGGNLAAMNGIHSSQDQSPPTRGKLSMRVPHPGTVMDQSPPTRGKHTSSRLCCSKQGSIPAYAGETTASAPHRKRRRDQSPPTRGKLRRGRGCRRGRRINPRLRGGNRRGVGRADTRVGSIPAYAGETARLDHRPADGWDQSPPTRGKPFSSPHVRGSTGDQSPPTRGKHNLRIRRPTTIRSIPAYAGETAGVAVPMPLLWINPRLRGGNLDSRVKAPGSEDQSPPTRGKLAEITDRVAVQDQSPPTRGKPVPVPVGDAPVGSIPAYAGETCAAQ